MLKLIIAEDEYIERKSLRFLIEKHFQSEVEIIAEVSNGKDVVEKGIKLNPDLILMDIQMPEMDGLQAAEMIKKQLPTVEIVILTAFSYFEYARNAIRLSVSDYLVKPFSNEEFCTSLKKVIKKIISQRRALELHKKNSESLKNLRLLVEKEIILEMVIGGGLDESQFSYFTSFFNIYGKAYTCLIVQCDTDSELSEKEISYIKERLKPFFYEIIGYYYFNNLIFLVFDDNLQQKIEGNTFASILKDVNYYFQTLMGRGVKIGLGDVNSKLEEIYQTYLQAKQALEMEKPRKEKNFANFYEQEIVFCEKIINEDYQGALYQYKNLMTEMGLDKDENLGAAKEYLKQLSTVVNRNIVRFFNNMIILPEIGDIHHAIENLNQLETLELYMIKLIKDIIETITLYKESRNQKNVNMVKDYIKEKYAEEISLNEVANYVGLSPFYLSRCFKRLVGISFKDYLIKIRIDKAKSLIRGTGKTIKEVAYEVGYTDPNYFSKAFKKVVGISPKEFSDR